MMGKNPTIGRYRASMGTLASENRALRAENERLKLERLPAGAALVSAAQAEQREQDAFIRGARDALESVNAVEMALHRAAMRSCAFVAAAKCTNGPETRAALKEALSAFVGDVQALETEMHTPRPGSFIVADWSDIQPAITYWAALRREAATFLADGRDAALQNLRRFLRQNDLIVKNLDLQIADHKKRGRKQEAARDLIGKMAAARPADEAAWRSGIEVLKLLRNIPDGARSDAQRVACDTLATFTPVDDRKVRADLGRYITRARKAHTLRSVSPNNSVT